MSQTEEDFAEIARAGLNWVRIPVPYWALETFDGEPFLAHVAWKCTLWFRLVSLRFPEADIRLASQTS